MKSLRATTVAWLAAAAALLAACGGGGGGSAEPAQDKPASAVDAQRFLTQATFGPVESDVTRVMDIGYRAWIDWQMGLPLRSHREYWDVQHAAARAADPNASAGTRDVLDSFYIQAVRGEDQLRGRVAFALSQIFVVSMVDSTVADNPRGVAGWLDVMNQHAFGHYRDLLEAVARHPMMGIYLSHLRNQKENPATGRVPDENFAREVMQLFSIGLYQLEPDGRVKLGADGKPIETYTGEDIAGLAKVFTGFSWAGPDTSDSRFFGSSSAQDPDRQWMPMQGYTRYHSTSEKRFLGATVAAQGTADPNASLRVALDTLAAHPNVGPFIGRQLIQRLVTSNPSPGYVARVAAAFADNGSGVRGDMKAVVRAVLLDPEARDPAVARDAAYGKLREPVLRLTALLRAFGATSDSGRWLVGSTDDAGTQLGQTPLRSPSVFNFYRPGYVPPNSELGAAGLAAPEMQITHETSVAGYANYMRSALQSGVGQNGPNFTAPRRDVQLDLAPEMALADRPAELVDRVLAKLAGAADTAALKPDVQAAVESIAIPALRADGSNQTQVDDAKRNRVRMAALLTLVSTEFLVQK